MALLTSGTKAPDFTLKETPDRTVSLQDWHGQPVILLFYPVDFHPLYSNELQLFNEVVPEFEKHGARFSAVSVDNPWCHLAFAAENALHFPLLSDFHPKGEVAKKYNCYSEDTGAAELAVYVIDREGMVVWGYLSPAGVNTGADGVLKALDELSQKHARV